MRVRGEGSVGEPDHEDDPVDGVSGGGLSSRHGRLAAVDARPDKVVLAQPNHDRGPDDDGGDARVEGMPLRERLRRACKVRLDERTSLPRRQLDGTDLTTSLAWTPAAWMTLQPSSISLACRNLRSLTLLPPRAPASSPG